MEGRSPGSDRGFPTHHSDTFSSSSAIDLTGTPAGLGSNSNTSTRPSSPVNLTPREGREGSASRRRLSWGRMERQRVVDLDPLRLNFTESTRPSPPISRANNDDPFDSEDGTPNENDALAATLFNQQGSSSSYFVSRPRLDGANTSSQVSLPHSFLSKASSFDYLDSSEVDLDDDEARLTSFASGTAGVHDRSAASTNLDPSMASGLGSDLERTPDKRKSSRYSTTPSTAERLKSIKRSLRRVSLRVVNLAGGGLEDRARAIRLPDDNGEMDDLSPGKSKARETDDFDEGELDDLPDLTTRLPIRGRTLGFMHADNRLRLFMYRILTKT